MSIMHITGVVFDFDGTLMDSAPAIAAALTQLRVSRGGDAADLDLVRKMVSHGAKDLISRVLGEWATAPADDIAAFRDVYGAMKPDPAHLYPGAVAALHALKAAGLRLGICTNKPQALTERIVEGLDLTGCFAAIVGGGGCAYTKPHPGHALETLDRMGVPAANAIYVGDSEVDGATAAAARLPFVLVSFGYAIGRLEDMPHAVLLDHFDQLASMVRGFENAG
jgi:phosphoglycolate phosphatase